MVRGEEDYIKLGLMEKLKCSFEPLLREIVLDSKECISNIHEYSGLGPCKNVSEKDDNKTYDVEEYIIDNFQYCFPYGQSFQAPKKMQKFVASIIQNPDQIKTGLKALFNAQSSDDIRLSITQYLFKAFIVLCQSFNDELNYIKHHLRGKETVAYLTAFAQHRQNSQLLIKKLLKNQKLYKNVIQPSLYKFMSFFGDKQEDEFKPQYFMATFLDFIWLQTVYQNQKENIAQACNWAMESLITVERIEEFTDQDVEKVL